MSSPQVWITKVTDAPAPSTAQRDKLGSHRWIDDKCYKYVSLPTAAESADVNIAANGDALGYNDFSAHLIAVDATDADEGTAGCVVNFANWDGDVSAHFGSYMWIQIKGVNTVSQTVGGSAGLLDRIEVNTSSTDLTFDKCTTLLASGGYVTVSASEVYLDCPY